MACVALASRKLKSLRVRRCSCEAVVGYLLPSIWCLQCGLQVSVLSVSTACASVVSPSSPCFILPGKIIIRDPVCAYQDNRKCPSVLPGTESEGRVVGTRALLSAFRVREIQAECRSALAESEDGVHVCLHWDGEQ